MSPIIYVLVVGAAGAYMLYPLLAAAQFGWGEPEAAYEALDLLQLRQRRDAALRALRDLEDERELGKLSEQDHDSLRAHYLKLAADWISKLDRHSAGRAV